MKITKVWGLILALVFMSSGCSLLAEHRVVGKVAIENESGHVVGHSELLRQSGSDGEWFIRVSLYTPRLNDDGEVVGYEEPTRGGGIIRDLKGKHVGNRFVDLRSRGTNPGSRGVTVVFSEPESKKSVSLAAAP